ncbi:SYCE1 protein, partial [Passerina amoena]|nr:SYCE1 protein [Passerina amoena]
TPQLEVLLRQVHSLKKVRKATAEELVKAQDRREELRQELEQLKQQKEALERTWQQVQESLKRAQLQGKEVEAKGQRLCELCLEQQQDQEGTKQQWEQLKNLYREQRWQQCQELEAIMEELKHLRVSHTPAHLQAELVKLEQMKEKWLSLERRVRDTEEQLGPEGAVLWRLMQQEQEWAERKLEAELGRRQLSLQRRDRLAEELQQLQHSQEARPE